MKELTPGEARDAFNSLVPIYEFLGNHGFGAAVPSLHRLQEFLLDRTQEPARPQTIAIHAVLDELAALKSEIESAKFVADEFYSDGDNLTQVVDKLWTRVHERAQQCHKLEAEVKRLEALGRDQWGCDGTHPGTGAPGCPRELHHHHDHRCAPGLRALVQEREDKNTRLLLKVGSLTNQVQELSKELLGYEDVAKTLKYATSRREAAEGLLAQAIRERDAATTEREKYQAAWKEMGANAGEICGARDQFKAQAERRLRLLEDLWNSLPDDWRNYRPDYCTICGLHVRSWAMHRADCRLRAELCPVTT